MSQNNQIDIAAFSREECDITNPDAVRRMVDQVAPNVIVNASAYTAVDLAETEKQACHDLNAVAVGELGKIAAEADLPVIHISTDYVFDGAKDAPYVESDEPDPQTVYGMSKLIGEQLLAQNNQNHVILRTAWVFSATGNNFLKTMLRLAADRDELGVVVDQFGNPSSADEIANAVSAVCDQIESSENPAYGTYHYCGPESLHWAGFAKRIFEVSDENGGPSANVNEITTADYPTPAARPANSRMDSAKFNQTFGYVHDDVSSCIQSVISEMNA